jgi:hypothetical protein
MLKNKIKINQFKKRTKTSQPLLNSETCDPSHEPETNLIEGKS